MRDLDAHGQEFGFDLRIVASHWSVLSRGDETPFILNKDLLCSQVEMGMECTSWGWGKWI